jgi:AraC-like DNA-binding protein
VLRIEVLKGGCSATRIARQFSMHRRTLNRRLGPERTAFRRVVDQVRFEIACELIAHSRMSFAQVAAALKFSELSAFTRAFRRWSGESPTAWRRAHPDDRTCLTRPRPPNALRGRTQKIRKVSRPVKQDSANPSKLTERHDGQSPGTAEAEEDIRGGSS